MHTSRRLLLHCWIFSVLVLAPSLAANPPSEPKPILLIVHGAWGGAWQFARVEPFLREGGYDVRRVTLTGLGERSHLARPDIGLETHIEDVLNIIRFERLQNVILLGHSYGGMVITGVADRMPERIAKLIYLDAVLPEVGESAADAIGPKAQRLLAAAKDGFIPAWWVQPGKPHPIDVPHPAKTFTDKLALANNEQRQITGAYVLTVEDGQEPEKDDFFAAAQRAANRGWPVIVMTGDHNPHWRQPEKTSAVIVDAIAR